LARVNRQREEPDVQWKAAAFVRWHEPDKSITFLMTEPLSGDDVKPPAAILRAHLGNLPHFAQRSLACFENLCSCRAYAVSRGETVFGASAHMAHV
jgi:hypothetical protein